MADISLIDPYSAQQESIARQRRMAQALQQQAQAPMEMPQMPGVLLSPYAGLAKVLQGAYGGYQEAEADKEYKNLVNEARTNQAADFASVIGALSAPGREGVAGQDFVPDTPAVMAPKIQKGFGGYGMPQQVGEYEVTPAVLGQPAIARQEPIAPGYISPELIASLKDPSMRQFAMAHAMAKLEPKAPISAPAGSTLLDPRTFKPIFTAPTAPQRGVAMSAGQQLFDPITGAVLATAAEKATSTTPHWEATTQEVGGKPVAGWINLNAADKAASFVAGAKPTEAKAATPHWVEGQKDVNGTTQFGWYDLNAADKDASFKAGAKPPVGEKSNWKEVTRGNQVFYEDFNVADAAKRQAGAIAKEAVKTPPHYSEIEKDGNVVIVDMSLPAEQRLANAQIKGPIRNNLEKITTTDANGREVTRYVDKGLLATMGDISAPYKGFMSDLAEAGQLPANWQNIPQIAGLVRENLINKAGGITPKDLANLKVRIAEAASRLAYEGVPGFNPKDLTPALSNFTTLSGGASAPAAVATSKITTRAEIADAAKRSGKSIEEVTRDAVAKGYKVQ
jgi:hypothetical protein